MVRTRQIPLAGPALKAVLPFGAGILAASIFQPPLPLVAAAAAFMTAFTLMVRGIGIAGDCAAAGALVFTGMLSFTAADFFERPFSPPRAMLTGDMRIWGALASEPSIRPGYSVFVLHCEAVEKNGARYRTDGLLTCILPRRELVITEGARVLVRGSLRSGDSTAPELPSFHNRRIIPCNPDDEKAPPVAASSAGSARGPSYRFMVSTAQDGLAVIDESGSFFGAIRRTAANLAGTRDYFGHRELLLAMTIGYASGLGTGTRDAFTRSGIAHLLAVSGMNVGVIAAAVLFILGFAPMGKRARFAICGAVLIFYAGMCGFQPPVTRALIMALILSGAFLLERTGGSENALFAALIVILACDPHALFGASLQLSFAAAWSLAVLYQPLMELTGAHTIRSRFVRSSAGLAMATIIASAVTAPIAAAHFGLMPLASLPINLPAVPLASFITIGGLVSLGVSAAGSFLAPAADALASGTGILLALLDRIAEFGASLPFASVKTGRMSLFAGIAFTMWFYCIPRSPGRPFVQKSLFYIPLATAAIWTWEPVAAQAPETGYAVFFDVGQGDAAIVSWSGRYFLVDTGPASPGGRSAAERVIVPGLRKLGVKRLDAVILSHMDADHAGGLDTVVRAMPAGRIFCRGAVRDSLAALYGNRVTAIGAGDSLTFDGGGMIALSPRGDGSDSPDENAASLTVRFSCGGRTLLFPGDIGPDVQNRIVSWKTRIHADVLKVPHHGACGLDPSFLAAAGPRLAVISCGLNNRFGHPSPETAAALLRSGAHVLRTDLDGGIMVSLPDLAAATAR